MIGKIKTILKSDVTKVFVFIFSCQVGSGTLILPSVLSKYGNWSIVVLLLVGILCSFLAFAFVDTGLNCHEIIGKTFGKMFSKIAFWLYWILAWFSTVVVVKEFMAYSGLEVSPFLGLILELMLIILLTYISTRGETNMVLVETIVTILKFVPVFFLLIFFIFASKHNFNKLNYDIPPTIQTVLKCLWCFFGVESGSIVAKNFNISHANRIKGTAFGMLAVLFFYIASVYIALVLGGKSIANDPAPYQTLFVKYIGKSLGLFIIRSIAVFTLLGTINSWILSTGFIGLDGAKGGFMPKIFLKKNQKVPTYSTYISSGLLCLALIPCSSGAIYTVMSKVIDISICLAILIYSLTAFAYANNNLNRIVKIMYYLISIFLAIMFYYAIRDSVGVFSK